MLTTFLTRFKPAKQVTLLINDQFVSLIRVINAEPVSFLKY